MLWYECVSADGSWMIDVTCTLSPPTALSTLPRTFVEATTLIVPAEAGAVADAYLLLLEQAVTPRASTVRAEAAASTLQMRRGLIEALLLVARTGTRCQ